MDASAGAGKIGGLMTTVILGSFAWGFLTCVMIVALFERER